MTAVVDPVMNADFSLGVYPGNNPRAPLVIGADGNFYGTTRTGGGSNLGTVFKVTPAGVVTTLLNFYGANGASPQCALVLGTDGNFYGTTSSGGANNLGTIFRMTSSGALTTLVNLTTANSAARPTPLCFKRRTGIFTARPRAAEAATTARSSR